MVCFYGRSRIEISHSGELNIENLEFVQHMANDFNRNHQGLDISNAHHVYFNNCSFVGMDNRQLSSVDHITSAVSISGTKNIVLDRFAARGNYGRVVNIESQCNVTVLDSEFTENVGSVAYIYSTSTVISDNKFHGNTGRVLIIDSVTTFITQCHIANNINVQVHEHYYEYYRVSIVHITPHSSLGKLTDSSTSGCSVPSSYSVVTSDTAVYVGSKASMNSSLLPTKATQNSEAVNNTVYHCTDISDVSASELRNVSDIIYDFTTSSSHGNRERLCVNTDRQHTFPFINRVVFCDDQTHVVITDFETDSNQDNTRTLTSERVGTAKNENSQLSIGADTTNNSSPTVVITSCMFANNTSDDGTIVIEFRNSEKSNSVPNVLINTCSFTNNTSNENSGAIYLNYYSNGGNILLTACSFTSNAGSYGEAISINSDSSKSTSKLRVLITSCSFTDGGVIYFSSSESTIVITSCSFTNNTSKWAGGAIFIDSSNKSVALIFLCSFIYNTAYYSGGATVYVQTDTTFRLRILSSDFKANSARCVHLKGVDDATIEQSNFTNNENSVYLRRSVVKFLSNNLFSNNNGAVYAFNSEVTFEGSTIFSNNYHLAPIYAVQSQIHFNSTEGITITNNTASLGGGIYLRESTMTVSHPIEISQNTADYGGGIYAYLSSIEFNSEKVNKQIMITNNNASQSGGGICAIASTIKISRSHVIIDSNTALVNGGGMYLEQNSRVTLLKHKIEGEQYIYQIEIELFSFEVILKISNNLAQYGGGIFVEDKTAGEGLYMCSGSATEIASFSFDNSECFIQTIALYEMGYQDFVYFTVPNFLNIFLLNNTATITGNAIFGGLFDRCTLNQQAEAKQFDSIGLDYISKTVAFGNGIPPLGENRLCDREWRSNHQLGQTRTDTNCFYKDTYYHKLFALMCISYDIDLYFNLELLKKFKNNNICFSENLIFSSVSSQPVQVMFCNASVHMDHSTVLVKKGGPFKVYALAMDQVGNPVNATIHSSVVTESRVGRLTEGQTEQTVGNQCTEIEYNVFSQDSSAQLELYADGPCTNLGISRKVINITFLPCICAVGLLPLQSNVECKCDCDPILQSYQITNCSQRAGTIKLETNIWIGVEENSTHGTGYIIHDCPFDYCVEKPVNISLNSSQERDRQCAFNRSGVLCGECQQGLSLVLGTSRCKECSNIYLLLLIPFALAGIVLVVFILFFNITIATGTIHGLIFYTNILAANKAIFLPFTTPNFLTVFVSWVNLDLGIETCFYSQMNSQAKVLLQLAFPAYLFLLIFLIIILSRYFNLFAELLSNRNPVAALATLTVLSYSKLLRFIISALQNTVLEYPDRSQERVWLYDANVQYFTPSHVPRFVAAAMILTAGGMFTVLLFFSQWLPRCSNWKLMKWTRNTKYTGFMDAYHAPFTPKHRYWVGLLLFALIIHNTIVAIAADTFLPVLSAGSLSVGLIVFKHFWSIRVYKSWLKGFLDNFFLSNLAIFANGTSSVGFSTSRQQTLACISMAITFVLFVMIISYHFYRYILSKTNIWPKLAIVIASLKTCMVGLRLRQAKNGREMYQLVADDQMDNDELLEALDYNNEQPDIVDPPLYTGGGEEEANTNQYHTPPNIVPATRPDQLREPDLDDLAPITTDDYRSDPHSPRARANNHQGVTYTVIEPIPAHEETLV